jgi:hypothetical protein
LSGAVEGGCPAAADLGAGIWLTFPHRLSLLRAAPGGLIEAWDFTRDCRPVQACLCHPSGLLAASWIVDDGQILPGTRERFSHAGAALPAPGEGFDGVEIVHGADGDLRRRAALTLAVGAARPVVIGGCTYTGRPVTVTRRDAGGAVLLAEAQLHLAELGVTIHLGVPPQDALPLSVARAPPAAARLSLT